MMCGVQLADGVRTRVDGGNLRLLGNVVRKGDADCVKQAWRFEVEGRRKRRRPRLAWKSMMESLCHGLGLGLEDA